MKYHDTKNKDVKIRETLIDDSKLIMDLIIEMGEYEKLSHEVIATEESIRESIFIKERAKALIIESDNKPIGYIIYFFNYSTFNGAAGLYIEDLYIQEGNRGKGIGKEAFKILAQIAIKEDCKRMEWTCLNWNEPSRAFYKKLGAELMDEWTVHRLTEDNIKKLI
ncbi:GNAT family N-acetyltransferase [Clostridium sp.]|uniref:GNAT family N-acetyltransferase n=1 Tax=Clostridium sp. TaxID=1506 RepID=UPI00261CF983|nr:GNAT family N-acetyltransferase [Clostridium sp.]